MNTLGPLRDRFDADIIIHRLHYGCKDQIDIELLREFVVMTPYEYVRAIESHIISVLIKQRLKK